MGRKIEDNLATMAKANFGLQFVRLASGQIGLMQFLNFALFRPLKFAVGGFLLLTFIVLLPLEAYCWYSEHTSFIYHLIKGDLESISHENSRAYRAKLEKREKVKEQGIEAVKSSEKVEFRTLADALKESEANPRAPAPSTNETGEQNILQESGRSIDDPNRNAAALKGRELKVADDELNKVYRVVLREVPDSEAVNLRSDQRKWIKTRDVQCNLIDEIAKINCLVERTENRTFYLKEVGHSQATTQ